MAATSTRLTVQVDSNTQELLTKAAAISGISSINSFALCAAIEKARKIIDHDQSLKLGACDAKALINALDATATPNPKLLKAAKCYDTKKR